MTGEGARARAILPGGVNSPVRAWGAVGGEPVQVASARGSRITDVDGREYVDLVGSWGPAILGHGDRGVLKAVKKAVDHGLSFGASTRGEVELAEEIRRRYPPAERVRLVSTGTEATMTALRLARAHTKRDVIVKFSGCYHGHSDGLLVAAGSGLATAGRPDSAGVPDAVAALTVVLPYNDIDAVRQLFAQRGREIAAVITEAAPANMGIVRPEPTFNAELAQVCGAHGAVFVVDEVLTGFRAGPRGWWGVEQAAAERDGAPGWTPDLVTFGKVIGGGLPVAAVAGRADIMGRLAPEGDVYQAGTLSGNPVAVASGLATFARLDGDAYACLAQASARVAAAVEDALAEHGIMHAIGSVGTLFSVFLGLKEEPRDFHEAVWQDTDAYARLFHTLREHAIFAPPSAYEAWFVSTAHTERDAETIGAAVRAFAAAEVAR